jgi:hypothetical protein
VSSPSFVDQCRPPWLVFPDLDPRELAGYLRQGVTEAYFFNHWRPFWDALDGGQRAQYLDHWRASPEWREAIEFHFSEDPAFDAEADVRESEEYLARHRQERAAQIAHKPWWARLFQSRN